MHGAKVAAASVLLVCPWLSFVSSSVRSTPLTPLFPYYCRAARIGSVRAIEKVLEQGVSINDSDSDGNTPLHYAAMYARTDAVMWLLNHGAGTLSPCAVCLSVCLSWLSVCL